MGSNAYRRSHDGLRAAFLLNILAALSLAIVFGIGIVMAVVAAREELLDSSRRFASGWVETGLDRSQSLRKVVAGQPLEPSDLDELERLAEVGHVVRYDVFRPDGTPFYNSAVPADGDVMTEPVDRLVLDPDEQSDVLRRENDRAHVHVVTVVPVRLDGEPVAAVRVEIESTEAAATYGEETVWSLALTGALAGIGLINCAGIGWLLRKQRGSHAKIYSLAHYDSLTGLANRHGFQNALGASMRGLRQSDGRLALHILDLDGFKAVNDTLGHNAGDKLLDMVGARITSCLGMDDFAARLGGDEFGVIQRGIEGEAGMERAERLAERMVASCRTIGEVDGVPVSVTLSVGVAIAPLHSSDGHELMKMADAAMYQSKTSGRDHFVMFTPGMDEEMRTRNALRMKLRRAVEERDFELYYQPLHAAAGNLAGFEALLRMRDDGGAIVDPGTFIPLLEDMGLTSQLGGWILLEACRTASSWSDEYTIAVNLSPQQFRADVVGDVRRAIRESGLKPERLELEITESLFIADPEQVERQLRLMKDLGVRIVMDDFGTGYSSLSYLWKFPFDKLKVDRSCFSALGRSENVAAVLRTISAMSGAMKLKVVAEGIETEAQESFARESGYDELQGFRYGRPMASRDVAGYISAGRWTRPEAGAAATTDTDVLLLDNGQTA